MKKLSNIFQFTGKGIKYGLDEFDEPQKTNGMPAGMNLKFSFRFVLKNYLPFHLFALTSVTVSKY